MTCPVCGLPDVETPCARCGTDLLALAGVDGETRLDIVPVANLSGHRSPSGAR